MKTTTKYSALCCSLFCLITGGVLNAQTSKDTTDISGGWEGVINIQNVKLDVILEFTKKDTQWTGSIDIPLQQAKDLPLSDIRVSKDSLIFLMEKIPGNPTFRGAFNSKKEIITGQYSQGSVTVGFSLYRQDTPEQKEKLQKMLARISAYADSVRKALLVPGAAIAIVRKGKVIYTQGLGYRNIQDSLPVTSDTRFGIASTSKAFCSASLGILVDDKKLKWDDKVKTLIPEFRIKEEMSTGRITPVDLVTHRTGLPRHDMLWISNTFSRKELVEKLKYLDLSADFRDKFQYNNLMFATASYLADRITGKTWEEFVTERIFIPLGMKSSNFSAKEMTTTDNYSVAYLVDLEEKKVTKTDYREITAIGGAGSINSTVNDLSKWVLMHLSDGKADGKQIISKESIKKIHTPHIIVNDSVMLSVMAKRNEVQNLSYGLGWFIESYRGHRRIQHGGNLPGVSSQISFLPEDDFGVIVLSNTGGSRYPYIMSYYIADVIMGMEPVNWYNEFYPAEKKKEEKEQEIAPNKKLVALRNSSEYVGEYEHPGYGTLSIKIFNNRLLVSLNNDTDNDYLEYDQYEMFKLIDGKTGKPAKISATFLTGKDGKVSGLSIPYEPAVADIVFKKKEPVTAVPAGTPVNSGNQ